MKNAWKLYGWGSVLIVLLTLITYFPAMKAGFVFDDLPLILDNPMVKASNGLHRFWFTTEASEYYPITWSLLWLEWHLWGGNPIGYHVVNVLLHAINAVLVWRILRRLKVPGAWAAGLVFAIHPVNVATAAWISEQKNTLSMLFFALAIGSYLEFDEKKRWRWYGLSFTAFLLAMLTKTAVVMLPIVLLGCLWWLRRKIEVRDIFYAAPFFALSLVMGLVNIWFEYHRSMVGYTVRTVSFASRLAEAGWAPWFYLYKALLPANLMMIYPHWQIDASNWLSYVPGVILVGSFAVFWWKRSTWGRPWLFGLGYFVVMLFPVLGFFDQGFYRFSLVADHWQYYSIVGVIALVVGAGEWIGGARHQSWKTAVGLMVAVTLVVASWQRAGVYADSETLWRDNVTRNPDAWIAHYNLGVALAEAGKTEDAIKQYRQALRVQPGFAEAHNNLGEALMQSGRVTEGMQQYQQALEIDPDFAGAHSNLGNALLKLGRVPDAIAHFEEALRLKPDYAEVHYNLGTALARQGRIQEALGHYQQALRINPDYADAHNNLGSLLMQMGRRQEAIDQYQQALRIKPAFAEAHNNLAGAFAGLGQTPQAIAEYEQALLAKPDYAEAHNNLGIVLAQSGRAQEAMKHFEEAVRIKPDYAEAHYDLGVALEHAGRVTEAISHYEQALQLKPNFAQAQNKLARLRATP